MDPLASPGLRLASLGLRLTLVSLGLRCVASALFFEVSRKNSVSFLEEAVWEIRVCVVLESPVLAPALETCFWEGAKLAEVGRSVTLGFAVGTVAPLSQRQKAPQPRLTYPFAWSGDNKKTGVNQNPWGLPVTPGWGI